MKDKSLKVLLGIIAVNLTLQTINQIGLFPTAHAQSGVQKIAICREDGQTCANVTGQMGVRRDGLVVWNFGK